MSKQDNQDIESIHLKRVVISAIDEANRQLAEMVRLLFDDYQRDLKKDIETITARMRIDPSTMDSDR